MCGDLTPAPLISAVVPVYNSGRFLAATLESIRAQTEPCWEAVIVDDGSSDDSAAIAESFVLADTRFKLVRKANGGTSAARNAGFRASDPRSAYVTFMDSDDVWLPDALEALRNRIEQRPHAIGSHGLGELIDEHGELVEEGCYSARGRRRLGSDGRRLVVWPLTRPTTFEVLINGNVLFPPGLLLARRSAYEKAGPFDERFNGPEDWDMLIRLSRHGDLEFVDRVILHYRRHDSNLGASAHIPNQAWLVRCKAFHSPANTPAQQRIARRGWRAYQLMMAHDAVRSAGRSFRDAHPVAGVRHVVRIGAFAIRWLRGYPLPRFSEQATSW